MGKNNYMGAIKKLTHMGNVLPHDIEYIMYSKYKFGTVQLHIDNILL